MNAKLMRASIVAVAVVGCSREPTGAIASAAPMPRAATSVDDDDVGWLVRHSMLAQAEIAARAHSGTGRMWAHFYGRPRPRAAAAMGSVWFTAYAASTITRPRDSVLQTLGDARLWAVFQDIGITGMHVGPMKLAGGVRGRRYTATIDGNFDRIGTDIDPGFGTQDDYETLTKNARARGAIVIGDVIPGHSGKGPDFRLAERAYPDYPGIYHMVEIAEGDWPLLPPVGPGRDSVNLGPDVVNELEKRGYIVGRLQRTIFYEKGVKDTDWSATDVVAGVDGKRRRWVYLHYFKEGQPTFNWLDPSFAAPRLVVGDAIESIDTLGDSILRLDANGFLGIERGEDGARAWSEGHPLTVTANEILAGMVRKLGGFTFQELNLALDDIETMSRGGPDLTYDFVTRPAYEHALVTGDAEFLRLMLALERKYSIDPAGLVHALQNHDELTLELVHFWTRHKDDLFTFRGKLITGGAIRDVIRKEMRERLLAPAAPYNLEASNGVSCTSVSLAAASLGIGANSWEHLTGAQKADIQRAHLLLAMYSAMQPGVFALSGWDLVGAATLPADSVKARMADGDTRWINRGAYDLLDVDPAAQRSSSGLPRARALYGSLTEQLGDPGSFASQLKKMLRAREQLHLFDADQLDPPQVKAAGLVVMVHRLAADRGIEVTALNFGRTAIRESVPIEAAATGARVLDILENRVVGNLAGKRLAIVLGPHQGQVVLLE